MPESNPNPENPYAAPQLAQAELVLAVEPAELEPGELPRATGSASALLSG